MIKGILVSTSNERKPVVISAAQHNLNVTDESTHQIIHSLNILTIKFELGGNNQNLVFLSSPDSKGEVIYFDANSENLRLLKSNGNLTEKLKHIDHKKNAAIRFTFSVSVGLVMVLMVLFNYRGPIAAQISGLVPFSLEKRVADKVFTGKKTPEQIKTVTQLKDLADRIKFAKADWPNEFTFHISSEAIPNAYATVGGHVFVNKGLIVSLNSPEELLGVLAHEMIHVQKRHVVKSVVQGLGVYTILSLLIGDITGVAAVLVDQGGPLLNLSYSRELEDEADQNGMTLLVNSGVDPSGLSASLQIINEYQKKLTAESPGSDVLEKLQKIEILNSHPEIEKRIERLRAQALEYKQSQNFIPVDFNFEDFKKSVKENF
jgi:beta-barrel assembly-enhancing protease